MMGPHGVISRRCPSQISSNCRTRLSISAWLCATPTISPFSIREALDAYLSSSDRCVTHSALRSPVGSPSIKALTVLRTPNWFSASKKLVISSNKSSFGDSTKAPARARRCFCPPDKVPIAFSLSPPRFTCDSARRTLSLTSSGSRA
mmetsp:Transcript_4308/g.13066  ORF Transcript_4308/g.13066 Transcript_4308/m.13066 type:complete len:147 (+) Transcript_4308:61-501(+)